MIVGGAKSHNSFIVGSWQDSKQDSCPGEVLVVCYLENNKTNLLKMFLQQFQIQPPQMQPNQIESLFLLFC